MTVFKRLLVPVDFGEPSRDALAVAGELASSLGAAIEVVHVVDLPGGHALASEGYVPVPEEYRREVRQTVSSRLQEWLSTAPPGVSVAEQILEGKPAIEITRYARDHRIDMIVMGTHARSGMAHLVVGSVAEHVVRLASCPVLTLHGPQADGDGATSFKE